MVDGAEVVVEGAAVTCCAVGATVAGAVLGADAATWAVVPAGATDGLAALDGWVATSFGAATAGNVTACCAPAGAVVAGWATAFFASALD